MLEAGGFKREADISKIKLFRDRKNKKASVIIIDLKNNADFDIILENNDHIEIPGFIIQQQKKITLIGQNVLSSGEVYFDEMKDDVRLIDVLGKIKFYIENSNNEYLFIITSKYHPPLTVNIIKYLDGNEIEHNPILYPDDIIRIQVIDKQKPEIIGSIKILGNFVNPGKYNVSTKTYLIDAISSAGWKHNKNEPVSIIVIDKNGGIKEYDINRFLFFGDKSNNPEIFPESSIYIREIEKNKVFIIGQVVNPGYYDLNRSEEMNTLARLINKAGGLKENAATGKIKIARDGIIINVSLDDYLYSGKLEKDFKLQRNDIIFVSNNSISNMTDFINTLVPVCNNSIYSEKK